MPKRSVASRFLVYLAIGTALLLTEVIGGVGLLLTGIPIEAIVVIEGVGVLLMAYVYRSYLVAKSGRSPDNDRT